MKKTYNILYFSIALFIFILNLFILSFPFIKVEAKIDYVETTFSWNGFQYFFEETSYSFLGTLLLFFIGFSSFQIIASFCEIDNYRKTHKINVGLSTSLILTIAIMILAIHETISAEKYLYIDETVNALTVEAHTLSFIPVILSFLAYCTFFILTIYTKRNFINLLDEEMFSITDREIDQTNEEKIQSQNNAAENLVSIEKKASMLEKYKDWLDKDLITIEEYSQLKSGFLSTL